MKLTQAKTVLTRLAEFYEELYNPNFQGHISCFLSVLVLGKINFQLSVLWDTNLVYQFVFK